MSHGDLQAIEIVNEVMGFKNNKEGTTEEFP